MSGMMGWLVFAVSVAAYVAAGWRLAVVQIPRMSEEARRDWSIPKSARSALRWRVAGWVLAWPIALAVSAFTGALDGAIAARDPQVIAERELRLKARIAELERELGMGGPHR